MEHYIKNEIVKILNNSIPLTNQDIYNLIEIPPKKDMGDYAFPCFPLAKVLKAPPIKIAKELVEKLSPSSLFNNIKSIGPYINFYLDQVSYTNLVLNNVLSKDYNPKNIGKNKTVVIDFSSPNIAKPFSIAHLRSTSIGNSLSKIFSYLGYNVVCINHLGDWGTSFGKLITAYKHWGNDNNLISIKYLLSLFVKFHREAENNPSLDDEARNWFRRLEHKDKEALILWDRFKSISLEEFKRMYKILNVDFDYYWGESYYQDKIEDTITKLNKKGLISKSQGAEIILLDDMPPVLLKKQDGATLYATRDITASIYRKERLNFDKMIYVVGAEQNLHFKQIFKVLEIMGNEWVKDCHHVSFGLIQFKQGKMSTRKGQIIFLEDVIDNAAKLALDKINESDSDIKRNNITDEEKKQRALKVGISSVVFFDLKNGRQKDIIFDWKEILNPKGETGIYLQYAHARLCGIIKNFEKDIGKADKHHSIKITENNSFNIAKVLSTFNSKVMFASENMEPSIIARYLLDLAQVFSSYYRINKVINKDDHLLSKERLITVLAVKKVLSSGLRLLGIEPLEEM